MTSEDLRNDLAIWMENHSEQIIEIKQRSLARRNLPDLKPSTIQLKGNDTPLVESGNLMNSFVLLVEPTETGIRVTVDNKAEYAKYHNTGFQAKQLRVPTKNGSKIIPNTNEIKTEARPWWFDEELDQQEIIELHELATEGIIEILNQYDSFEV